jgi:hypothetical protein
MRTNATELVRGCKPAEDRPIAYMHVPGNRCIVREDRIVTDLTVMGYMGVGHDPVVIANTRNALVLHGSTVDRARLANRIAIPDHQLRRLTSILLVLRVVTNRRELKNVIILADHGGAFDNGVRFDPSSGANLNISADNHVRTYSRIFMYSGIARHDSQLMNHSRFPGA